MGFKETKVLIVNYLEKLEHDIKLIEKKIPTIIEKIKNIPDEVTLEQIEEIDGYWEEVLNMLEAIELMGKNND